MMNNEISYGCPHEFETETRMQLTKACSVGGQITISKKCRHCDFVEVEKYIHTHSETKVLDNGCVNVELILKKI